MHTIIELLDLAKEHSGITSDNKLSEAWGVARAQISQWRNGKHVPDATHAGTLAHLTGLSEQYVLLCLVSAEGNRSAKEREVLRQIAEKIKRTAAVVTLAIAGILGLSHAPTARAATETAQPLNIMVNVGDTGLR